MANGKQYIVVAVEWKGVGVDEIVFICVQKEGSGSGGELVALALP